MALEVVVEFEVDRPVRAGSAIYIGEIDWAEEWPWHLHWEESAQDRDALRGRYQSRSLEDAIVFSRLRVDDVRVLPRRGPAAGSEYFAGPLDQQSMRPRLPAEFFGLTWERIEQRIADERAEPTG